MPRRPVIRKLEAAVASQARLERSGELAGAFRMPEDLSIFLAHDYSEASLPERNLAHLGVHGYDVIHHPVRVWSNPQRIGWCVDYLENQCRTEFVIGSDAADVNAGIFISGTEFARRVYRRVLECIAEAVAVENSDSRQFDLDETSHAGTLPHGVGGDQAVLRYLEREFHPALEIDADSRVFLRNTAPPSAHTGRRRLTSLAPRSIRRLIRPSIWE